LTLGVLLFFQNFLAAHQPHCALLVQLDDADFDLLAEIAVQIADGANLKLRAGKNAFSPMSTVTPPLTRLTTVPITGVLRRGLLNRVPDAQPLRPFVARQIAALRSSRSITTSITSPAGTHSAGVILTCSSGTRPSDFKPTSMTRCFSVCLMTVPEKSCLRMPQQRRPRRPARAQGFQCGGEIIHGFEAMLCVRGLGRRRPSTTGSAATAASGEGAATASSASACERFNFWFGWTVGSVCAGTSVATGAGSTSALVSQRARPRLQARLRHRVQRGVFDYSAISGWTWILATAALAPSQVRGLGFPIQCQGCTPVSG